MSGSMHVNFKVLGVEVMPGAYFLGDPQFAMTKERFQRMLREEDFEQWPVNRQGGSTMLAYLTADGDGEFQCSHGYTYLSESGLLGLVPIDEIPQELHARLPDVGRIVTFSKPALCMNINGVLHFDALHIRSIVLNTNEYLIGPSTGV